MQTLAKEPIEGHQTLAGESLMCSRSPYGIYYRSPIMNEYNYEWLRVASQQCPIAKQSQIYWYVVAGTFARESYIRPETSGPLLQKQT